jgi:hypothetical protein
MQKISASKSNNTFSNRPQFCGIGLLWNTGKILLQLDQSKLALKSANRYSRIFRPRALKQKEI